MNIDKLKSKYEKVCSEYVQAFMIKQEIDFDFWIGDEIGDIASFAESYYFNLSDIVFDINNDCPKGLILSWQDDSVDAGIGNTINYSSYSSGLRYSDIKKADSYEYKYEKAAKSLWKLLDDIDTSSDMYKPTIENPESLLAFYNNAMRVTGLRFDTLKSTVSELFLSEDFEDFSVLKEQYKDLMKFNTGQ